MNNLMTIHFFRNNSLQEKLDFQQVVDFFASQPNFQIFYTDDCVEIEYKDEEFGFKYSYLITRKSRVSQIYKLSPKFTNVNMLVEFPIMLPSFLAKEVLTLTQKLCKTFELGVYNDVFEDVRAFNIVELMDFYESSKKAYIELNGLEDRIQYNAEKLNVICKFQRSVTQLEEYYHNDVIVNPCYGLVQTDEVENNIQGICYDWKITQPIIFPPYVDFIKVTNEDEEYIVKRSDLFALIEKRLIEIKNFLPDMYIIKGKQAKNCRKYLKKISKIALAGEFKNISLLDCIEG